jgi:hypothetical protein
MGGKSDLPSNPTIVISSMQILVTASWTLLLMDCVLAQHDTHLGDLSRCYSVLEFQQTDGLVIFRTYEPIITLLDKLISESIFAISIDDVVKVLTWRAV